MSDSDQQERFQLNEEEMTENKHRANLNDKEIKINDWVIYCKPRGKKSGGHNQYTKDLQEVGSFNTLSGFYKYHTSIKQPSKIDNDIKLIYFLKGCEPLWEKWLSSGCLLFHIKFKDEKTDKLGEKVLNKIWEYLLFSLVGNCLPQKRLTNQGKISEHSGRQNMIGLVLGRRQKLSIIQIWFRSDTNAVKTSRLIQAEVIKQLAQIPDYEKSLIQIRYSMHKDSYHARSTIKGSFSLKGLNSSF